METPTSIEDSLEIIDTLGAAGLHSVAHQHLGIARDSRRRCAQFLPQISNERPLRSPIDILVNLISHRIHHHGVDAVA